MGSPAVPHEITPAAASVAAEVEMDDARLVRAAQADRRAFAPLYERYVTPVYRYCYHRLGNREAAEDATSLIFTKALGALARYQPDAGSFRSWLFVIAHNTIADDFRRLRPVSPLPDAGLSIERPGPEALAIAAQEQAELHRLLAELPTEQRRVLELRLSGLNSPEVAAILGRSPTAIRSLQFRAVERLRARLAALAKEQTHDRH
jgi:RNA polymerase sigma-70 factor (ECF subfamily)